MPGKLAHWFRRYRRESAIKTALRRNEIHIDFLAKSLLENIAMDAIYADFPRLPRALGKEWRQVEPYRFKLLTDFRRSNNRIAIRVHEGDSWLGTFIAIGSGSPHTNLILPQDLTPSEIAAQAENIFTALIRLKAADAASRECPRAA